MIGLGAQVADGAKRMHKFSGKLGIVKLRLRRLRTERDQDQRKLGQTKKGMGDVVRHGLFGGERQEREREDRDDGAADQLEDASQHQAGGDNGTLRGEKPPGKKQQELEPANGQKAGCRFQESIPAELAHGVDAHAQDGEVDGESEPDAFSVGYHHEGSEASFRDSSM